MGHRDARLRLVAHGMVIGAATLFAAGSNSEAVEWWTEDYDFRTPIAITAGSAAVPNGYTVALTFAHAHMVAAGQSQVSGDDVRVVYWDGAANTELHRVVDPLSDWNTDQTTIWFATQAVIASGATDAGYYLYYGHDGAKGPPADEREVFHFADFFDRPDSSTVGGGWWVAEGFSQLAIADGSIVFESSDELNRPLADHTFPADSNALALRVGFDWARTGIENDYRLHIQLGSSPAMETPPAQANPMSSSGIGPSLLWAGPSQGMNDHEGLGHEVAAGAYVAQMQVVSGAHDVEARVDVSESMFTIRVDGTGDGVVRAFSSQQDELDTVRLMTWGVNTTSVSPSRFDYVIIRRLVDPEPRAWLAEGLVFVDGFEGGDTARWSWTASPVVIDIFVDEFCSMSLQPPGPITVPPGRTAHLLYRNLSAWYEVDIWLSYGGGRPDVPIGSSWFDPFDWCEGSGSYIGYADISATCSLQRLLIECQ